MKILENSVLEWKSKIPSSFENEQIQEFGTEKKDGSNMAKTLITRWIGARWGGSTTDKYKYRPAWPVRAIVL